MLHSGPEKVSLDQYRLQGHEAILRHTFFALSAEKGMHHLTELAKRQLMVSMLAQEYELI